MIFLSHARDASTYPDFSYDVESSPDGVADLLLRARGGDSEAWEGIVRRYSSVVFAAVRSFRLQEADVLDAVQMTWLRFAENCHGVQYPERLAGWLATTARRECLHILRQQAKQVQTPVETVVENLVDPDVGPEQRVIDSDVARTLCNLVAELSPLRRTLVWALYADNPPSYIDVARTVGIQPHQLGPTRARALRQLRRRLNECGLGPESEIPTRVEEKIPEGNRTGSYHLDSLLDEAELRLREVLEPDASPMDGSRLDGDQQEKIARTNIRRTDIVPMVASSGNGTGDARLDDLLSKADDALREVCDNGMAPSTTAPLPSTVNAYASLWRLRRSPPDTTGPHRGLTG